QWRPGAGPVRARLALLLAPDLGLKQRLGRQEVIVLTERLVPFEQFALVRQAGLSVFRTVHRCARQRLWGGEAVAGLGVGVLAEGEDLGRGDTEDQALPAGGSTGTAGRDLAGPGRLGIPQRPQHPPSAGSR